MIQESIRNDFPILQTKVNNKPLIYFDNAATSQKPKIVIDKLVEYYSETNANIHRGTHYLADKATEEYEESKRKVASFINAKNWKEIIYTKNTTESVNLVAYAWGLNNLKRDDLIISTEMEHHSNIVPWQLIANKTGAKLKFIPIKKDFTLDIEEYEHLLSQKPKIVNIVQASNVTGTINPVKTMTHMAHEAGALVLVDGAQSTPHMKVDMQDIDCDFFAFSSHKMCGPTGIGVLYSKERILEEIPPFMGGGEMIESVSLNKSEWNELPYKFEAGTPNIADAIAFGTAIDYLNEIGIENINSHIKKLVYYALKQLLSVKGLEIFGTQNEDHGSMVSFTMEAAHSHDVAEILNQEGIAVRAGHHCAQPLHEKYNIPATTRASFYFYNTREEIDKMIGALNKVNEVFK